MQPMKNKRTIFWALCTACLLLSVWITLISGRPAQPAEILRPSSATKVAFTEPSDILIIDGSDEFLIPADKAFLYKVNRQGEKVATMEASGFDLEAVCQDEKHYYVSEETYQKILVLDKQNGRLIKEIPFKHGGGRNEGVEAMACVNGTSFVLATEKDPQYFFLCDKNFQVSETFQIADIDEVSGMCWYKNKLYVLSDESETIYEVDIDQRKILRQWQLNVINPEGIAINEKGEVFITCDDMARIYTYTLPL
jgi:uncharacterized protein YjiK